MPSLIAVILLLCNMNTCTTEALGGNQYKLIVTQPNSVSTAYILDLQSGMYWPESKKK